MKIKKLRFNINLTIYFSILFIYIEIHIVLMQNYLLTVTEHVVLKTKTDLDHFFNANHEIMI
jgi:hypothetical protein